MKRFNIAGKGLNGLCDQINDDTCWQPTYPKIFWVVTMSQRSYVGVPETIAGSKYDQVKEVSDNRLRQEKYLRNKLEK